MAIRNAETYNDDQLFDGEYSDSEGGNAFAEQLDLQHYLRILRKRKWPITLFTAAVIALASYYAFTATPVYSSTSTLLIEYQNSDLIQFDQLVGLDAESQDYYETQYELLRSRGLALRVVEHLNLWEHPELSPARAAAAGSSDQSPGALGKLSGMLGRDSLSSDAPTDLNDSLANSGSVNLDLENQRIDQMLDRTITESVTQPNGAGPSIILRPEALVSDDEFLSADQRRVVNNFMARLSIAPVRKTKLVKVTYESTDPNFAALVANVVGEQYIESYLDAKLELTTQASSWLNERLTELRAVLDESESRLIAFKEANGLVDVDGSVGRLNEQELLLATAELAQAQSDLAAKRDVFNEVQALRGQPEALESIPAIQADPLVQRVKIEQGQAQRALDELRNRYGERHPRVVDASSQLATLDTTLEGNINRVVGAISSDYQLVQQRVATIQSKLAQGKQEIQAIGTKKFELDELDREVATNREIYDTFFSRITEAKSADGLDNANARISDRALPALSPIKPQKELIIALAALASLVLSMLMALLYEQMDDTVKSTRDIEEKLGVKLLGILPLIKTGWFKKSEALPLNPEHIEDAKGTFVESVNTARTILSLDEGDEARQVIVVTSSVPGEGKSTTSINLAHSFGQLERVLIIDCDMRRPTLAKAAGLDRNVAGLSNLITQTAHAKKCLKRGMFGGSVDILPSGPLPEQPLELISSKRFEKILDELCQHYDRIIIDSAPTQAVSDALVISKLSDAVVYCVKSHETSLELVRRGLQRLRQVNAPLAGVIITQVDVDKIQSYGGDYYYQGYYDYYGYNNRGEAGRGGKIRLTRQELYEIRNDDREVELDLDYGLEQGAVRRGRGQQGVQRGGVARGSVTQSHTTHNESLDYNVQEDYDVGYEDELDMTTELNLPIRRPGGRLAKRGNLRPKSDNLDII